MSWRIDGDPREIHTGADSQGWAWSLQSGDGSERRIVIVEIGGTAMTSSTVPPRLEAARRGGGRSEIEWVLNWEVPPKKISFHSLSEKPDIEPGEPTAEVREITEIIRWFEDRGIALVFTGRGGGTVSAPPGATLSVSEFARSLSRFTHTANLIDSEADELLARLEAQSRVAAAREARRWWMENEESRAHELELADRGELNDDVEAGLEAPRIPSEQREELDRREIRLVLNGPTPGGPDTGYLFEAYDRNLNLVGLVVAQTADDAWLILHEDLFGEPPPQ